MQISYLLGSDLASLGSMFSLEPAPSPVPDRVSYEKTKSTQTTALETLMTRGASEERAKVCSILQSHCDRLDEVGH